MKYQRTNEGECRTLTAQHKEKGRQLLREAPEIFKKLGRMIRQWFEPIIRMWRFSKSNGIMEEFHRKMKLIQRRSYGYRNFKNYRLRVLIECEHVVVWKDQFLHFGAWSKSLMINYRCFAKNSSLHVLRSRRSGDVIILGSILPKGVQFKIFIINYHYILL